MRPPNLERMRRYSEAAAAEVAAAERRDWLSGLTPEHRAKHEGGRPIMFCRDCMDETNRSLGRALQRMSDAMNRKP